MKYWKYCVGAVAVLLLVVGGVMTVNHHNKQSKSAESHMVVKKHDSKPKEVKAKSSSKESSAKSSDEVSSSQPQASSSVVTDDTTDSGFAEGQPTSNSTLTEFLNKYGVTPVEWLVQNKGMSFEDALYATPDEQEMSGELQSEWAYKQGTYDDTVSEQSEDDYWSDKAREPNADYYGDDGSHYHNDDQGHTYDDDGNVIGKGSNTVGMGE